MHLLTWHGAIVRRGTGPEGRAAVPKLQQDPVWLTADDGLDYVVSAQGVAATATDYPVAVRGFADLARSYAEGGAIGFSDLSAGFAIGAGGTARALAAPIWSEPEAWDAGIEVIPGDQRGTVHLRRAGFFLTAAPTRRDLTFDGTDRLQWETFLLVAREDLADLRHILSRRWKLVPGHRTLEKGAITLSAGFTLELGSLQIALADALPLRSHTRRRKPTEDQEAPAGDIGRRTAYRPPNSFVLTPEAPDGTLPGAVETPAIEMVLAETAAEALSAPLEDSPLEIELRPRRSAHARRIVTSRGAFRGERDCELVLEPEPVRAYPPLVVCDADRAMVLAGMAGGAGAIPAPAEARIVVTRTPNRFVLLTPGGEGVVFDRDGAQNDAGGLTEGATLPDGLVRRDGRVFAEIESFSEAAKLPGPSLVFYDGRLGEYAHFVLNAMVALDLLVSAAPPGARLLIPPSISAPPPLAAFQPRELMALLGFGNLPMVDVADPVVWADDLVFVTNPPESVPAVHLRAFRDRLLEYLSPRMSARRRLLLLPPAPLLEHEQEMRRFLEKHRFEAVRLDKLPLEKRISLFQEAEFVVSQSCDDLVNIVFSPAGTRVLEFLPDRRFEPHVWGLAAKLGHIHAVIGADERPDGPGAIDIVRFKALFRMLDNYG